MTFASIKKLIREEVRRVVENLERSFSLYEDDEKPASENPDKMLVVNKESGKSYYINKDSFDPSKHQKSSPKSPTKEEEEPKSATSSPSDAESEPETKNTETEPESSTEKSASSDEEKPEEKPEEKSDTETSTEKEKSDSEKKDTEKKSDAESKPEEEKKTVKPNEEKTGLKTVGFLKKNDKESLSKKSLNVSPDSQEKLLGFDYEKILDIYDDTISKITNVKEKESIDKKITKICKKVESIAVSKHSIVSKKELDGETIFALRHYYKNSGHINNIIRFNGPLPSENEIDAQIKMGKPKKEDDPRMAKYKSVQDAVSIYNLDSAFSDELQRLDFSIVTYRSVENSNVLQMLIDAGQWVDTSFVTTSLNPIISEKVNGKRLPLFEFFIPAGTSILALPCGMNDYCHETEVTLPRNCRFTIQGFNADRIIYKVLVEQNYA